MRLFAVGTALSLSLVAATSPCTAADEWGGSLGITSDYIVRGISRSDNRAALQLDLHYLDASGILAGVFASNTRIDPDQPTDVELDAFLGFAWAASSDWRGKVLASYYAYPWNAYGTTYNYAEVDLDLAFREWLDASLEFSPNEPRYVPFRGIMGVTSESAEVNLQRPIVGRLSATAGVGYAHFAGPDPAGYAYWSFGAAFDLAPVTLVLTYVDTTAGAKTLFYNAAADHQWLGTVIWRF